MTAYEMLISDWSSDVCSSDLRDAESGRRILQRDQLALGVPGVERFTGRVAPQHLDDVVDQFLRLLGAGDPLRGNRDGLGLADAGVGPLRHHVLGKEPVVGRSEEHTSELQSLMRISYAVFCLKKKKNKDKIEKEIRQT